MIDNPEIAIDYSLTYKDFVAGHKLATRQNIPLLLVHIIARYIASTLAFLAFVLIIFSFLDGQRQAIRNIVPLFILLSLMPVIISWGWRIAFNRLRLNKSQLPQMTFKATSQEFSRQIHGMGELTWLWSATHSFVQNKKIVLISVRKNCFIVIPRQFLTEDQINRLNEFQQRKGIA